MSQVNFLDEFRSIMRFASQNSLSLRERMLWIALFYAANDRAVYNENARTYDWPDGFFSVANSELNLYCCLDKRGIETVRNQLKQRGLIDFTPGFKNRKNPAYKLLYISRRVGRKIVPNDVPNNDANNVPNDVPNTAPSDGPKEAPLPKLDKDRDLNKADETPTTQTLRAVEGAGAGGGGIRPGYSDLISLARESLQGFGKDDEAKLMRFAYDGMEAVVIRKAIYDACAHECPKIGYVLSILRRYKREGILTLAAAHEDDRKHKDAERAGRERPADRDFGYQQHSYTKEDFAGIFYDPSKDYEDEGANEA